MKKQKQKPPIFIFHYFLLIYALPAITLLRASNNRKVTFVINDILENNPKSFQSGNDVDHLRHQDVTGLFSEKERILPTKTAGSSATSSCESTDHGANWWSFLTSLQPTEFGTVSVFDKNLMGNRSSHISMTVAGKVQGICVTSSVDNGSHMVAMKESFESKGGLVDSLRFFGVYKQGLMESEIAVTGGSGRYSYANGFATMKAVGIEEGRGKRILFNVYVK